MKRYLFVLVAILFSLSCGSAKSLTYSETVTGDNPVLYMRMDDTSGTTAHALVGPDGSYVGSPALKRPSLLTTDADFSVKFDGNNDAVNDNAVANHDYSNGFTLEAWVSVTRSAPSDEEHIMNFSTDQGGHAPGLFHDYPSNKFKCAKGSDTNPVLSNKTYSAGIHHVVCTVSPDDVSRLYVDGVLQNDTGTMTARPQSTDIFSIGADHDFGPVQVSFWRGRIDEVAVYNYALSTAQVQAHYAAGR